MVSKLKATALGEIPEEWSVCSIDSVAIMAQYGLSIRGESSGAYPMLRMNCQVDGVVAMRDMKYVDVSEDVLCAFRLERGDILFNRTNSYELVGRSAIYDHDIPAVFASYLIRLRVDQSRVHPAFLNFLLNWDVAQKELKKLASRAVGQANISASKLKNFSVHLPHLTEQRQIVDVLRRIRALIANENNLVTKSSQVKSRLMEGIFTCGLRGETQKETEIGFIPESWQPRTILDLCEILSGGTPRKSVAEHWTGEIPWASGKDLKVPRLHDTIDHVSAGGIEAGSRLVPANTVFVLVRGMGLAKDLPISVISCPMAFNQDIKALVSRGEFSGTYIGSAIYSAKHRLLSRIVPSAHGTMTLNLDDIECFKIPCPNEQSEAEEIVAILDAVDRKIDLHKRKRTVLEELFKTLLHKLMTGEIRVADLDLSALASSTTAEAAA